MNFGAFFLSGSPAREDPSAVFARLEEYIVLAEELGYDSVWFAEHHFSNYGYIPNPLLLATRAAAITERVRIGTAVLVLPFWHPLRVAEDIALTDHLTGGRLEVGVARGYQPFEFRRFGLTFDQARARTDESLEILLRALTGEAFEWSSEQFEIPETTVLRAPLQQPRPPIWLAAHTPESFDLAARLGLNAFTTNSGRPLATLEEAWNAYQDALAKYPDAPRVLGVQAQICVAPTDEEAAAQAEHFLYPDEAGHGPPQWHRAGRLRHLCPAPFRGGGEPRGGVRGADAIGQSGYGGPQARGVCQRRGHRAAELRVPGRLDGPRVGAPVDDHVCIRGRAALPRVAR